MQDKRILLAGYGKLGQRVAAQLATDHPVMALKRSPQPATDKIRLCFADLTRPEQLRPALEASIPQGVHYLIYCLSPSERSEHGYRNAYFVGLKNLLAALPYAPSLEHIIFVSSTSVFHHEQHEWVDEQTLCQPEQFSGRILLEAERYLQGYPVPSTIVRFSGIYGGGRSRLIDQVRHALATHQPVSLAGGFSNRIHEDDCVGFLCHLIKLLDQGRKPEALYIASDSMPVELADVYCYIAAELQKDLAAESQTQLVIQQSEGHQIKRRAGSKRCTNQRMLNSGYQLKYPSYREGYAAPQASAV